MDKSLLKNLPTAPGVYKMLDDSRTILYIGKAGNLKKRVSSYFTKSNQSLKNQRLIHKIKDIDYQITSNEQDALYSGFYGDYGAPHEASVEEVAQRDRSSGRNKRPSTSKDYSRYGQLERGNEFMEKMARDGIPYILDQSTWNPSKTTSNNEALVDNWRPRGIIVAKDDVAAAILKTAEKLAGEGGTPPSGKIVKDIDYFSAGVTKKIMLTSLDLGVPIYNTSRTILWSPEVKS